MIIKQLKLENIGRYVKEVINFPEQALILILGDNGSGKTTLMDANLYALFGKTSKDSSKDDIVTLNESYGSVKLTLQDNDKEIDIIRSRDIEKQKTTLTLFIAEENKSAATIEETEKLIQQLLNIDYIRFRNSISFAQGEISQFLAGTDQERKNILSTFLNLEIYDEALTQTRTKIHSLEIQIEHLVNEKDTLTLRNIQLDNIKQEIEKLQGLINIENSKFIILCQETKNITNGISLDTSKIDEKLAIIDGLKQLQDKIKRFYDNLLEKENRLNYYRNELDRIDLGIESTCPTCYQEVTLEAQKNAKKKIIQDGNEIKREQDSIIKSLEINEIQTFLDFKKYINALYETINQEYSLKEEKLKIQAQIQSASCAESAKETLIKTHEMQIDAYTSQINQWQLLLDKAKDAIEKQNELDNTINNLKKEQEIYKYLEQAFGVNGIRTLIFENIIPILESKINKYIGILDTNIYISLETQVIGKTGVTKEKFAIYIQDEKGKREIRTFSGGEKRVIAIAVRLAFSELTLELSGSKIKFLLLDEITDQLDHYKKEQLYQMLMQLNQRFKQILIISHDENFQGLFQNVWKITKVEGRSQIEK